MFKWLRRFFGARRKYAPEALALDEQERLKGILAQTDSGITVDLDQLGPEAQRDVKRELIRLSKTAVFEGRVEHGYASKDVPTMDTCPRCQASTRRMSAHFIYGTDRGTRVMLAPAGYFCSACPTVIVDEALIAGGVTPGFQFWSVVGIHHEARPDNPDVFRTWNGQKPIYILDEEAGTMDMSTGENSWAVLEASQVGTKDRQKAKRKRQLARQARKRNRRR